MQTYREEIYTPYGPDEAARRISEWLEKEGRKYKVLERSSDRVRIKRGMPMNPDIFFQLRLTQDCVRAECWVKGMTKEAISPKAIWGAISRRTGWNDFQKLKEALSHDVIPGRVY